MKKIRIFGAAVSVWPLVACIALASVVISGTVIAEVLFKNNIDYGQMKKQEIKSLLIATTNQTIDPYNLNFTTNCTSADAILSLKLDFKSDSVDTSKILVINGNTSIDVPIDAGNISLTVKAGSQGFFNCSVQPIASNYTLVNFTA